MARIIFNITYGNSADSKLTLTSQGNSAVSAGDSIQWNLIGSTQQTNIKTIDNVNKSSGSNLFNEGLGRVGSSNNFSGTIENPIPPSDTEEEYSIDWTDANNNSHTFDPKLTVNT